MQTPPETSTTGPLPTGRPSTARVKHYSSRFFFIAFSTAALLLTTACIRSFFTPDSFLWRSNHPAPTDKSSDAILRSSRGGLALYFTSTTFPDTRPRPGEFAWSHDKSHLLTGYPQDPGPFFLGTHITHRLLGPFTLSSELGPPLTLTLFSSQFVLILPYPLLILLALAPTPFLYRKLRQQSRTYHGFCPACGYDLRASPDRCPECGRRHSASQEARLIH